MPCHVQYITSSLLLLVIAKKRKKCVYYFLFHQWFRNSPGMAHGFLAVILTLEFNLAINADGWYSSAIGNAVSLHQLSLRPSLQRWLEVRVTWRILFGFFSGWFAYLFVIFGVLSCFTVCQLSMCEGDASRRWSKVTAQCNKDTL